VQRGVVRLEKWNLTGFLLTCSDIRASLAFQRRSASSAASESGSFKAAWLSDPSTYPILGILTIAVVGCSAFMTYKITRCPDVRVSKSQKGQVIRPM
jgi:NADH-ubiquinone reductase complex 1 MLRQ subunit